MGPVAATVIVMTVLAIPIIAIIGGVVAGIMRAANRQRLLELAHRERIAALERGIDPAKLPPLPAFAEDPEILFGPRALYERARRRSQSLLVGGVITVAVGLGILVSMALVREEDAWPGGIIPLSIGLGLLLSAWLVRPRPENGNGGGRPPAI